MTRKSRFSAAAAALLAAFLLSPSVDATTVISPTPKARFEDNNGNPCTGCKVFTYAAGSTTKQATYTDSTGGTSNVNPIVLDTRGEANVWFTPGQLYKITLAPSTDTDPPTNAIWTVDQLGGVGTLTSITCSNGVTCTPNPITGAGTVGLSTIANNSLLCNGSGGTAAPVACSIATLFPRIELTGNRTYYLNASTGNDSNDCLGSGTACLTPQHVQNLINNLDLAGFTVTVTIADGSYTGWNCAAQPPGGAGPASIIWNGNQTTPGNVVITGNNAITASNGCTFEIFGATLVGNGNPAVGFGYAINATVGSDIVFNKLVFAACNAAHMFASTGSLIRVTTPSGAYSITGSAPVHLWSQSHGLIQISSATVTLVASPAFSTAFAQATELGAIDAPSVTFSGAGTGQRYLASLNGIINTGTGAGNVDNSYLPGNVAGASSAGGYYN
jgi:hypothetical protein